MPEDITDFIQTARERYDFGRTADAYDREQAEADNAFANADNKDLGQWDDAAKKARKRRPILQWNRIPTYIQQVVNDGRQNKPAIRIAAGDGGKPETAEYFQSRIRHIEYEANIDTAKDTARDQQVTSGRGFSRVRTEYVPGTFQQRIRVDRIENQFSVVWDPASLEYDRSDAAWCFVISLISRDEHKRKYGEKSLVNRLDFADACKLAPDWIGLGAKQEMVQIADYYVREFTPKTLCLLGSTGVPVWKEDLAIPEEQYAALKASGSLLERVDECAKVMHYVINGAEILDQTEWIGSTIPIVPFWGREATVNGTRRTYSLSRNAQGPQKLLNLYVSNAAELIGQMPKSPYMVPVGGIPANSEGDWKKVNIESLAFLLYNQYDESGRQLAQPSRITAEPPIQALAVGINQCIDAIKASMGIFDAALGARSNENSGLAIERRRKQSNVTNYHFADNEARSNKYLGQILVELIAKLDEPGKQYPTRTEDGKTNLVPIGVEHQDPKTGKTVCHDLRSGQYDVTVSTQPSYLSQREEAFERDVALVQADPTLMWVIGDQMFANDDSAGGQERAERMKKAISMKTPGLIEDKGQQQPIPDAVKQQIMQQQQELQATQEFAKSLHEKLETKQPELDNAVRLKQMDLDFKREELAANTQLELVKIGSTADIAGLRAEIEAIKHERGLQASQQAQEAEHEQAENMADKSHVQGLEAQQQAAALQPQPEAEGGN